MSGQPLTGELLLNRPGRKPKFNKRYLSLVIEIASMGKSISHFCVRERISRQTYYSWVKKYADFKEATEIAKEAYKAYWSERLMEFAFVNPAECNTRLLERMFNTAFEISHDSDTSSKQTPININLSLNDVPVMSPEQRAEKLEALKTKLIEDKK